jgi:hypothetical protein
MLWNGNLVPLCQHSQEKAPNNPQKGFKDNYELPLAQFDIHASQGTQCTERSVDRRIFRPNLLEVYCQMSILR